MKKLIPVAVAVILIILIGAFTFGSQLIERYTYSNEKADLNEYFGIYDTTELPIILQNDITQDMIKLQDGSYYMEINLAQEYFDVSFYTESDTNSLYYTTADEVIKTVIGSELYTDSEGEHILDGLISYEDQDVLYINLEYLKKFANFSYTVYSEPGRVQIYTQWEEENVADLSGDTSVREKGGIKSPILTAVSKGTTVVVLEEMETWTKVKTDDGFIGYVENKFLENERTRTLEAVNDVSLPEFDSTLKDYTICMGWHAVYSYAGNDEISGLIASTQGMTTVSPTWFSLKDDTGNYTSFAEKDYVEYVHEQGMEVWAVLDDFNTEVDYLTLFSHEANRTSLIQNLMNSVDEYDLDGINIDFENITEETADHFIQFIRELSIECREKDIVLSIDNYVPREHTSFYNRKEQGIYADYVIIMGYDEHWSGSSDPGSVASIDFVEDGIVRTLEEVPAEKVINAIPFYTRIWTTTGSEVTSENVGMEIAETWVENHGIEAVWDEETCQNYAEYETDDSLSQVWLEDEQSIQVKLNIMSKYGLAGMAAWRLGFEKADVWDEILLYLNANE